MKIDAHQHFWQIARGDYGWLTPDLAPLYRDFLPGDLQPMLDHHQIDGTILVQAAPTVAETHFMLDLARQHSFVKGVVGWVDFAAADAAATIADLAQDPALVGLRPMIQDIADPEWMLRRDLTPAFAALIECDLTFDALTLPQHLAPLLELVSRHPDMQVVIDHASKPRISEGAIDGWAADIARFGDLDQVSCKISGMVTEADADWSVADLEPYVAQLLSTFGSERLIWGSDWPVCQLAASYEDWLQASETLLSPLSPAQRAAIFGLNAARIYKIGH